MTAFSTEPTERDFDVVREVMTTLGVTRASTRPGFLIGYLANVVEDLAAVDDPMMARRIGRARALMSIVDEELA